ncbi:DR1-associated protein 1 (negative cofactor 2 alpha) [Mactra antiquata]
MPSKKKKYNARFPPARIKKIMQTDEEVGKVAAAVPVIISRALELFIDSLIQKTASVTRAKNAKTLSSSHIKQAIQSEKTFDFLQDLVKNVPDHQTEEEMDGAAPSSSKTVEKKQKVPRPRKPREEGARGPGRPRKVKVEEKKESASEPSDEETETDEETVDSEPSNLGSNLSQNEQYNIQSNPSSLGAANNFPSFGSSNNPSSLGASNNPSFLAELNDPSIGPSSDPSLQGMSTNPSSQGTSNKSVSSVSPVPASNNPTMSNDKSSPQLTSIPHLQSPPQPGPSVNPPPTSNIQELPSFPAQYPTPQGPPLVSPGQQQPPQPGQILPNIPPGFPMHNMGFPSYPFIPRGPHVPPFMHPQTSLDPHCLPNANLQAAYTQSGIQPYPPRPFLPVHPGYMMPHVDTKDPRLLTSSGVPGMPIGAPPPLYSIKQQPSDSGDSSMPLDMSMGGNSRLSGTPSESSSSYDRPSVTHHIDSNHQGVQHNINYNTRSNQNVMELTVSKSQTMGPPPLVGTNRTQSNFVTENGSHKLNNTDVIKTMAETKSSRNPSDEKSVSFPGLANIMNMKPVRTTDNDENDDDYDS